MKKIGRNDPCPCGSGKKYKKCCLDKKVQETSEAQTRYNPKQLKWEQEVFKRLDVYREIASFFECSRCGRCCREGSPDLLFSDEYQNFDEEVLFWEDGLAGLINPCPFYVENKCKIHSSGIKPRMCRVVPFYLQEGKTQFELMDCELGEKILEAYHTFLEETGEWENNTIDDLLYPFDNLMRAKSFLKWLKKKYLKNNSK